MQSDDTYRSKLQQTMASIQAWTGFVADVARIEQSNDGAAWRLALTPRSARACPVEIVLRNDRKCDITIGDETHEDWPIPSLDLVLPLLEAVVEGRVMTRHTESAATGLHRASTSVVVLGDGTAIERSRGDATADGRADANVQSREVHYLPYRRSSGC